MTESAQINYIKGKHAKLSEGIISLEENTINLTKKGKIEFEIDIRKATLVRNGELMEKLEDFQISKSFQINTEKEDYVFIFNDFGKFINWLTQLGLKMKISGTYGYPLRVACLKSGWRYPIPFFRSIQYLRYNNGIETEGIFRISPSKDEMLAVKKILNSDTSSESIDFGNVRIASAVCKNYLASLDDPIIPYTKYDEFVSYGSTVGQKEIIKKLRKFVENLPTINKNCLWYLIDFLHLVSTHKSINLMSPLNLAVCFGPTCVRKPDISFEKSANDINLIQNVFEALIEHYEQIFKHIKQENEMI